MKTIKSTCLALATTGFIASSAFALPVGPIPQPVAEATSNIVLAHGGKHTHVHCHKRKKGVLCHSHKHRRHRHHS